MVLRRSNSGIKSKDNQPIRIKKRKKIPFILVLYLFKILYVFLSLANHILKIREKKFLTVLLCTGEKKIFIILYKIVIFS